MLPKKYHAIIFICILVMLLLLGLHLLGIGYSGSQAAAKSAALRNSSQPSSSASALNAALSQNQVYRHPISYDKLTGATNNQISDVLGAKQPADYPIDHYQQHQHQQQQQQQQQPQFATNPLAQDEFFTNIHRQAPAGFPSGPPPPPPLGHHLPLSHRLQVGPPPLVHQMGRPHLAMTTQPPMSMPLPPLVPPNSSSQRSDLQPATNGGSPDSLSSASSLTGASGARPPGNNTQQQQQFQLEQQQQPAHYTPPIFAYNNFEVQQPQQQPSGRPSNQFNEPADGRGSSPSSFGFGPPSQRHSLGQQVPLGLPDAPMSPDDNQTRQQARLRQLSQQQLRAANEVSQQPNQQPLSPNLLADPQQQQRHKQQMLDRQLLFGSSQPMSPLMFDSALLLQNQTGAVQQQQHGGFAAAADPAALYRPGGGVRQPPYAHSGLSAQLGSAARMAPASLGLDNNGRLGPSGNGQLKLHHQLQMPERQLVKSLNPAPLLAPSQQGQQLQQPQPQQQSNSPLSGTSLSTNTTPQMPMCAAKQRPPNNNGLELANSTGAQQTQPVVLFCNEDPEYPTKEIMRALEAYATERSIEQLLPQLLIHMDQRATSAGLDPLQPVDTAADGSSAQSQRLNQQPMSNNYESMCRSGSYLAQPRRARNLLGQWKVVVNLPGHKYRGIAVSQMVRVEECLRPNGECSTPSPVSPSSLSRSTISAANVSLLPKSRCLQHYESQRLVAWSHQQGLHLDIFRVPIACSCHIRR